MLTAKRKAADYFYASGEQKLNKKTQIDARNAYADFEKVIHYAGTGYRDVEARKEEAQELGTAYVLYQLKNLTNRRISDAVIYNLADIRPSSLNSFWVRYEYEQGEKKNTSYLYETPTSVTNFLYQYHATFSLNLYEVSPVVMRTKQNSYNKTITDGTEYLTDSKGKPILDSTGNFIKVPKKIHLTCNVVEVIQEKRALLGGSLTYHDVANNRQMRAFQLQHEAIAISSVFDIKGDTRALSETERKRVSAPAVPLPLDENLLILCSQDLGEKLRQAMKDYAWQLK